MNNDTIVSVKRELRRRIVSYDLTILPLQFPFFSRIL